LAQAGSAQVLTVRVDCKPEKQVEESFAFVKEPQWTTSTGTITISIMFTTKSSMQAGAGSLVRV